MMTNHSNIPNNHHKLDTKKSLPKLSRAQYRQYHLMTKYSINTLTVIIDRKLPI